MIPRHLNRFAPTLKGFFNSLGITVADGYIGRTGDFLFPVALTPEFGLVG